MTTAAGLGIGTYFGTEDYDLSDPARNFEERRTRCYELAGAALAVGQAPRDAVLVHGTIDGHQPGGLGRIGHAWLWLPDGGAWEPITGEFYERDAWVEFADARVEAEYTRHELGLALAQHETWGPWHDHDYR